MKSYPCHARKLHFRETGHQHHDLLLSSFSDQRKESIGRPCNAEDIRLNGGAERGCYFLYD
jgi:hypothetical protein